MYHDLYKYFTGHLDLKEFCLFLKALCMYNIDNIKKDKKNNLYAQLARKLTVRKLLPSG